MIYKAKFVRSETSVVERDIEADSLEEAENKAQSMLDDSDINFFEEGNVTQGEEYVDTVLPESGVFDDNDA